MHFYSYWLGAFAEGFCKVPAQQLDIIYICLTGIALAYTVMLAAIIQ